MKDYTFLVPTEGRMIITVRANSEEQARSLIEAHLEDTSCVTKIHYSDAELVRTDGIE